jgi:hypothetical protein
VAVTADGFEDALGDCSEDPVDDASIHHAPLTITVSIRGSRMDMALEAELAEGGVEEVAPLAIVGFIHVEDDRDMVADGDALDLGGRGRDDREPGTMSVFCRAPSTAYGKLHARGSTASSAT